MFLNDNSSGDPTSPAWFVTILVYLLGSALFFLEIFIPSGGLVAVAGVCCVGYAFYTLFATDQIVAAIAAIVLTLAYSVFLVRWGLRRLTLADSLGDSDSSGDDVREAAAHIGEIGKALSDLRPSGLARIGGRRLDVVTVGKFVDEGQHVKVVEVSGNRVVVTPTAEPLTPSSESSPRSTATTPAENPAEKPTSPSTD